MRLTQQQLEAHLWGAANILRGKTAGQDYKNYILSLMFYKRLCDQWENEADEAIAELERQQGRQFTDAQKAVFRARGEHRFSIPDGSRWGDVLAASVNLGEKLTQAMRAVAAANEELKGVFTVDWNQPAPDGSGKPLIPNEVVHALIQHFDSHDLSNASVPPDVLGHAYEYLIKQFADDAGAKAGEFFTPPEVVDTLVRILEPQPGDTIYDPTCGSGGMLVHSANFLRESEHHATSAQYFGQEMNWGNAAIGKINSVLHGLEATISAGVSTITDPAFKNGEGKVRKFSLVLANFPFSDEFWWLKPEQQTDDKKKKDKLKKEIFGKEGYKDPFGRFGRGTPFKAPPAGYGDLAFELGEGEQDVQHQPPHRRRSVELLGHRHKGHFVAFEHFDQPSEVGQAAGQPVDLVDDHDVDLVGDDVAHEALQCRSFHVATGVTAIIVVVGHGQPAFGALACDVGMTGFPLRVQGIERLIEPFVCRNAGVDRATFLGHNGVHFALRSVLTRPKNTGPDHCVPVMCLAAAERLLNLRPS